MSIIKLYNYRRFRFTSLSVLFTLKIEKMRFIYRNVMNKNNRIPYNFI